MILHHAAAKLAAALVVLAAFASREIVSYLHLIRRPYMLLICTKCSEILAKQRSQMASSLQHKGKLPCYAFPADNYCYTSGDSGPCVYDPGPPVCVDFADENPMPPPPPTVPSPPPSSKPPPPPPSPPPTCKFSEHDVYSSSHIHPLLG